MRAHDDPAIAAQPFAADVAPLPLDYTRCYDWFACPLGTHCRRAEPVGDEPVSQALFYTASQQRGGCEHFIDMEA